MPRPRVSGERKTVAVTEQSRPRRGRAPKDRLPCRIPRRAAPGRAAGRELRRLPGSPAVRRSPVRTSSGLTAGVPCRRTTSSIAHSPLTSWPSDPPPAQPPIQPTRQPPTRRRPGSRTRAGRFLVIRSTATRSAARNFASGSLGVAGADVGQLDPPVAGLQPLGQRSPGRCHRPRQSSPAGSASSSAQHVGGVGDLGQPDLERTRPRWLPRWAPRRRRRSSGAG